jgi:hypothetical protein
VIRWLIGRNGGMPLQLQYGDSFVKPRLRQAGPELRLEQNGNPPRSILAARIENGTTVRTRPLCPYPQVAGHAGSGSIDEAKNFVCRA